MSAIHVMRAALDLWLECSMPLPLYLRWRARIKSALNREDEMLFLRRVLSPGMVFADIGANIGTYAVPLSAIVGPSGAVHAFEPIEATYGVLALNSRGRTNIRLYNVALSDRRGSGEVLVPRTSRAALSGFQTSASLRDTARQLKSTEECTPTTIITDTLDYALRSCTRLDVVKCDVEGHEERVLRGAAGAIERFRPILIVEILREQWPGGRVEAAPVYRFLREQEYVAFRYSHGSLHTVEASLSSKENFVFIGEERVEDVLRLLGKRGFSHVHR